MARSDLHEQPSRSAHNEPGDLSQLDEARGQKSSKYFLRPEIQSALTIERYAAGFANLDFSVLIQQADVLVQSVTDGDMGSVEGLLAAQALTLNVMFHRLSQRAAKSLDTNLERAERLMKLAFKAQSQCRTTSEALASMKNPSSPTFVRQTNIGNAVQVNNGTEPASAREIKQIPDNKLMEATDGERLDTRTPRTAVGSDPAMATVGRIDRAANR